MACAHGNVIEVGARPAPCGCYAPALPFPEALAKLRNAGWMVAVHNDYRQHGRLLTFWLFVRNGIAVKGEGYTDAEALVQVLKQTPEGR